MADQNSDYNKEFTDLFELLPEVFKSETNRSVFKTVFNRYFSKPEIERVTGLVGQPVGALAQRQINEPTPHRQAYQLQPWITARLDGVD